MATVSIPIQEKKNIQTSVTVSLDRRLSTPYLSLKWSL